jgi:hypothetical protein
MAWWGREREVAAVKSASRGSIRSFMMRVKVEEAIELLCVWIVDGREARARRYCYVSTLSNSQSHGIPTWVKK